MVLISINYIQGEKSYQYSSSVLKHLHMANQKESKEDETVQDKNDEFNLDLMFLRLGF